MEPRWLTIAQAEIGQQEIAGARHNPRIVAYHQATDLKAQDDETAWCASFVGWCLGEAGLAGTFKATARSYERWGDMLADPVPGCIAVLWRGSRDGWQGHVGFWVGEDPAGNMLLLGGNQGNRVSVAAYPMTRLLSFRWPAGVPLDLVRDRSLAELAQDAAEACRRLAAALAEGGS